MFGFNPLSQEFQSNPYAFYHMLQENAPVLHWPTWNMWFLSTYEDCASLLRDNRVGREWRNILTPDEIALRPEPPDRQRPLFEMQRNWMLFRDPPAHSRLRGLVHKAFTPRIIEHLRGYVQDLTNQLLDAAQAKGGMEVISEFAFLLPVTVIAELVGVPANDRTLFRGWSRDLAGTLELTEASEVYDRGADATQEFAAYLRTLIAQRRESPQDDLLTALIAAEQAGDTLTEEELVATVILLLVAGHETTVNLIGNGILALLRHPDQFARLHADPTLARGAVEEILRYDSPVQLTSRTIFEDGVEFGGKRIPPKTEVAALLGAANRDARVFADPDRFDITRAEAGKHIAFGNGIHFCLGAPLARLEGEIALRTVAERFPKLALTQETPVYRPSFVLHGLEHLTVTV